MRIALMLAILTGVPLQAYAQTSAGYKLEEHAFNAGGNPQAGTVPTSTSYRMTLDAIGDSVVGRSLAGASYRMDGGFGAAYPPPGEVSGLRFTDSQTLAWDPERSVGDYNLYRDQLDVISALAYGQCEQQDLTGATATDTDTPSAPGEGFFYLVTASNRLGEEGTKGWDSVDVERPNPVPCP